MQVNLSERITLTDERPESSYRIPVALIDGQVYGPGDLVGAGGHAAMVVQAEAAQARLHNVITTEQLKWCARFWR